VRRKTLTQSIDEFESDRLLKSNSKSIFFGLVLGALDV